MQSTDVFRFSTAAVPARDRMAVWREVIGREYMCLDVEPDGSEPLWAELEVHRLPATLVTFLRAAPMKYMRTVVHARKGDEDFTFASAAQGGFSFSGEGKGAEFGLGDAVLLPNNRSGTIEVRHNNPLMTIRVNGASLRGSVRDMDERLINRLDADNRPLRLALSYVGSLLRCDSLDAALGHVANEHILDLLALGLRPNGETRERARAGAVPAARLAAIRADILANLGEMHLSTKTVAKRHGVSERYVHLLFEQTGLSFNRFVVDERLKRAMSMLLDPALADRRISDLAFGVGFGDLTTFNRAFRRRYGATPSDVRRTARHPHNR